jgi:hypothetical protein
MEKPHRVTEKEMLVIEDILKKGNEAVIETRKDGVVIIEKKIVRINR